MKKLSALHRYIDICLIDEHAEKDLINGYSLDVDDLSDHERSNFLDELMQNDTHVRDYVLNQMQKLINDRLPECEARDKANRNLKLSRLSNGDIMIESLTRHI